MTHDIVIIGSGPSGIAAAQVLVEKGKQVLLLDAGLQLEGHLQKVMGQQPLEKEAFLAWVYQERAKVRRHTLGLPLKLPFGSAFVYASKLEMDFDLQSPVSLVCSLAKGGLSNVWGANISLLSEKDLECWPISSHELKPYYEKILKLIDFSGADDATDQLYNFKLVSNEQLQLGRQGQFVYNKILKNSDELIKNQIFGGMAKLAVGRKYSWKGMGCSNCGQCMHGCVYDAIFRADFVLNELIRRENFKYIPYVLFQEFKEKKTEVLSYVTDLNSGATNRYQSRKLIIAAGVLRSTALVAKSLGLMDHLFEIKDSQKYLFPFITEERISGSAKDRANTLAQLYIQAPHLSETENNVHCQLYGYNDLILAPMRGVFGNSVKYLEKLGGYCFDRLMVGMAYLHSNDSGSLWLKVYSKKGRLGNISGELSRSGDRVFQEFIGILRKNRQLLGGAPMRSIFHRNQPGSSQHFGGSIPMSSKPNRYQTDIVGRPFGCSHVHLVDSTIFPTIPAVPLTFSMMANSARIADSIT